MADLARTLPSRARHSCSIACARSSNCSARPPLLAGARESADPGIDSVVSVGRGSTSVARRREAGDVIPGCVARIRDTGGLTRSRSSTSQDQMNQGSTSTAIAVDKWVDGFELSVCDGRLRNGGKGVFVAESDEILEEVFTAGWRRDEGCCARVVVTAADPVLYGSELTTVLFKRRSAKQPLVDL